MFHTDHDENIENEWPWERVLKRLEENEFESCSERPACWARQEVRYGLPEAGCSLFHPSYTLVLMQFIKKKGCTSIFNC